MKSSLLILAAGLLSSLPVQAEPKPEYVCSACLIVLGLAEQINLQLKLGDSLKEKCGEQSDKKATVQLCQKGVDELILALESKAVPEEVCKGMSACNDQCNAEANGTPNPKEVNLFVEWPIKSLPPAPKAWPVERRLLSEREHTEALPLVGAAFKKLMGEMHYHTPSVSSKFEESNETMHGIGHAVMAAVRVLGLATGATGDLTEPLRVDNGGCGTNVTCHAVALAEYHAPLQDTDGDRFATADHKTLRGSHWRGEDCNDVLNDVYPGRMSTEYGHEVDHNCNGIVGADSKGSFEEQFCEGTGQRGLIMLGDSATAHFHIPPQWMTADGWNLDGFTEDALDELDAPHCSWGTGHATPEECPYQDDVPGPNPRTGITSLYTKMRERNRCNSNDFQNIGVNGARMSSSLGLVEAMAREATLDHPALVWLTLIGNDVCNGHPGFEHMSTPESFYDNAMAAYNRLDELLPPNSYVVATDLFDGELLYETMQGQQHPLGTTYDGFYDFMNCLQINPCWGWLNTDAVVRANTTSIAHSLNDVYTQIDAEQNFKNFKLIHFSPNWREMFDEYTAGGLPAQNLIEKIDGFHPSQAANYMFADYFWRFMETEHPEAIGDVNPHNAEIDARFFSA